MTRFWRRLAAAWLVALAATVSIDPAAAQAPIVTAPSGPAAPKLPETLTPQTVDSLMARLSDQDVRTLLRDELVRRSDASSEGEAGVSTLDALAARYEEWRERALDRWRFMVANLPGVFDSGAAIERRLALAEQGIGAMIGAALAILAGAVAAAFAVHLLTGPWRRWLKDADGASYWDRVARTVALGIVEFGPIVAFAIAVAVVTPYVRPALGPLLGGGISYVWIFEGGVLAGWTAIVLSRRAFAPWAPELRIARLSDAEAHAVHRLVRQAVFVGVGGWLIAGLAPTFGFGFALAIAVVALTGLGVYLLLTVSVARNIRGVRERTAQVLAPPVVAPAPTPEAGDPGRDGDLDGRLDGRVDGDDDDGDLDDRDADGAPTARRAPVLTTILVNATPWVLLGYLAVAYLYWLARWFETGQSHLVGPLGTLLVLLAMPTLDSLGDELARGVVRRMKNADRFHRVLLGAWRVLLALVGVNVVALLWGLNLIALAKGPDAPAWASAAFDVAVTLLIGQLIWRLIQAALYQERRIAGGDLEEQTEEAGKASRLDTLIPLFRILLLIVLTIIVAMMVLSALGMNIGPLLASAGIVGIAIGFGAQTLVRDIFSGMFFLIDDAFRVGEYIELEGDLRGEVEALSIRSLQLRHHRGAIVTIPFGELKNVTNHNRDWVIYKMSFRLEPDTDPAVVKKIVKRIGFELLEDPLHGPKFLEPLKSQGVFMIDSDSALVMRVKFKAKPRMQFVLRREVYHRLRTAFAEAGIKFARTKVEVVSAADAARDAAAAMASAEKPADALADASKAM